MPVTERDRLRDFVIALDSPAFDRLRDFVIALDSPAFDVPASGVALTENVRQHLTLMTLSTMKIRKNNDLHQVYFAALCE
jgi:hypothetical protein